LDFPVVPYYRTRMTTKLIGTTDRFEGYGETVADDAFSTAATHAEVMITYIDEQQFGWRGSIRSFVCYGDSGGPHLLRVDGKLTVAGITSTVGLHCADYTGAQRVDVVLPEIEQFIADNDPQPAAHCGADGICGPRACGAIDPDCPCAADGF